MAVCLSVDDPSSDVTIWGVPFDGTFAASVLTSIMLALSWFFTWKQIRTLKQQTTDLNVNAQRTECFSRWGKGVELMQSSDEKNVAMGLVLISQLEDSKYITDEDRALVLSTLDEYTRPQRQGGVFR